MVVRKEFLGFTPLNEMDAEMIAGTIIKQCNKLDLNLNKLHGQGYNGCSAMVGKENGVKARSRSDYLLVVFAHCAAHRI